MAIISTKAVLLLFDNLGIVVIEAANLNTRHNNSRALTEYRRQIPDEDAAAV
jgi:hypothetical protein